MFKGQNSLFTINKISRSSWRKFTVHFDGNTQSGKELFDWGLRNNTLRLTRQPHAHRCRACASVELHGRGECSERSHNTCPNCQQAINATLAAAYERNTERQWRQRCQQQAQARKSAVTIDGWDI